MPKGILEFSLPEEEDEFKTAQDGGGYKCVLSDMDNYLRGRIKYEELPKDVEHALRLARQRLQDLAADYDVSI